MVDLTIVAKPRRMSEPVWVSMVVEQLMKKKRKASSQTQKKRGEGRGRSNRERSQGDGEGFPQDGIGVRGERWRSNRVGRGQTKEGAEVSLMILARM